MTGDGADRRRHARVQLTLAVRASGEEVTIDGVTRDVSLSGAFVEADRAPRAGAKVEVSLSLPGLFPRYTTTGVIRWSRGETERDGQLIRPGFGIEWDTALPVSVAQNLGLVEVDIAPAARTFRVLVADDNHHVRELLKAGIGINLRRTHDVQIDFVEAADGREALAVIEKGGLDLVIVDVAMPVVDGVMLLDHVRRDPDRAMLPVMVVSAGGPEVRVEAMAAGADVFLAKPLRLVDLVDTVERLLHLGSGRAR